MLTVVGINNLCTNLISVSYTHLDVYKRQPDDEKKNEKRRRINVLPKFNILGDVGLWLINGVLLKHP